MSFFNNVGSLTPNEELHKYVKENKVRKNSVVVCALIIYFWKEGWITDEDAKGWYDEGFDIYIRNTNGKIENVSRINSRLGTITGKNNERELVIRPVQQVMSSIDDRSQQFIDAINNLGYKVEEGNDGPRHGRCRKWLKVIL